MDDAQQIVVDALERAGIVLPPGVAAVHDIGPATLISICSQALGLISGRKDVYMPGAVPQSVSVRFRLCTQLAEEVKQLGYRENLNFHQFLYPNEADVHQLLRFLLDQLSRASSTTRGRSSRSRRKLVASKKEFAESNVDALFKGALSEWTRGTDEDVKRLPFRTCQLRLASENEAGSSKRTPPLVTLQAKPKEWLVSSVLELNARNTLKEEAETSGDFLEDKTVPADADKEETYLQLRKELQEVQDQILQLEKNGEEASHLDKQYAEESQKLELVEDEFSTLQAAVGLIKDSSDSPEKVFEQLNSSCQERRKMLDTSQTEWKLLLERLEREKFDLEQSLEARNSQEHSNKEEAGGLQDEDEAIIAKINTRKEQQALLTSELEKCPKQASRSSYVRRITELIKNSKKQDADVTKIIMEMRTLQRDNNATLERLGRIHALVDELIFRDAKQDPQCRQAYRLFSSMHEGFSDLVDRVLEMDKLDREIVEVQAKLETLDKEKLDLAQVQADLNAMLAENKVLTTQDAGFKLHPLNP